VENNYNYCLLEKFWTGERVVGLNRKCTGGAATPPPLGPPDQHLRWWWGGRQVTPSNYRMGANRQVGVAHPTLSPFPHPPLDIEGGGCGILVGGAVPTRPNAWPEVVRWGGSTQEHPARGR